MRYLVIPQWQGSASDRAMCLADGAEAIAGDLPAALTTRLEVPLEAGDTEGTGILRHSSLRLVRERFARAVEDEDDAVVAIGGDSSISYPGVARAAARHGELTVVWLDAHADCLDVATSSTGAFAGMTARALVDDELIPASRLILAGTRAWEGAEREWVQETGTRTIPADRIGDGLAEAVAATGAPAVYLHIGLDVLDPSVLEAVAYAEPFGASLDALLAGLRTVLADHELAGATIAGFAPRSVADAADDLPTLLRILGALRPRTGAVPPGNGG